MSECELELSVGTEAFRFFDMVCFVLAAVSVYCCCVSAVCFPLHFLVFVPRGFLVFVPKAHVLVLVP